MAAPPHPGDHDTVYGGVDDYIDDDEEEDQNDDVLEEDDEDIDVDDDSTTSSNIAANEIPPPPSSAGEVTIAVTGGSSIPESKRQILDDSLLGSTVTSDRKPMPLPLPLDESRRLFQRLWTDEDEIELLQGFLNYNIQRGFNNSHHHDTAAFYDQIKCKLQLDFNKNQLVEKLRRLKKKYRNVLSKLSSGKDYVFKSPHDKATFEISKKIWSGAPTVAAGGSGGGGGEFDEDEGNPKPNLNFNNFNSELNDHNENRGLDVNSNCYNDSSEKKVRPRKRSRGGLKIEEKQPQHILSDQLPPAVATPLGSIPNLIEETVKSCVSPLFKELLNNAVKGLGGSRGGFGGVTLNSMLVPLGFAGGLLNFAGSGDVMEEKWRKQQILELEIYSKRLELVQDQINSRLEELRSMGS